MPCHYYPLRELLLKQLTKTAPRPSRAHHGRLLLISPCPSTLEYRSPSSPMLGGPRSGFCFYFHFASWAYLTGRRLPFHFCKSLPSMYPNSPAYNPGSCFNSMKKLRRFHSVFRYFRLIVNLISHWTFKPIPIPEHPSYTSQDVTVIIPTIDGDGEELRRTIKTCLATQPHEVIIVTVDANIKQTWQMASDINSKKIRVLSVEKANKRRQMCEAIPEVTSKITVFADDDVIWPAAVLQWMLAPFEDEKMGGVGTSQRLMRPAKPTLWSFLGSLYLERRNFDCSACLHIDGGLPCLSGRTVAYRTKILQDEAFTFGFTHETWRTYQLNADDDNFVTRWMYSHGWKIAMQYHKAAEVQTTLEDSPKYLKQCLRWVRSNWRSNLTSLFVERHYWW